jgi:hypothetical protein
MKPKRSLSFLIILLPVIFFFQGCSKSDSGTGLAAINTNNDKKVGSSGRDLLSSQTFTTLNIEIQYMAGFAPDAASLNNLTSFLNTLINKPGGIAITQKEIPEGKQPSYTIDDIATIEQKERTAYNSGNQLAVYVLITDAQYSDPSVLGVAYRNTSLCLIGKTIFDNSGNFGQSSRTKLETTVSEHEFGHLLGLVNTGTPMVTNHEDDAHGHHCNVKSCLMYYATETSDIFGFLVTENIPALDSDCLADLHANGGK